MRESFDGLQGMRLGSREGQCTAKTEDKQKALAKYQEFIQDKHASLVSTTPKPVAGLLARCWAPASTKRRTS